MSEPISRYDLELRLLWLNNKLNEIRERYERLLKEMLELGDLLLQVRARVPASKVIEVYVELWRVMVKDLVVNTVAENLNLNTATNIDLGEDKKVLGSVLVEDMGSTKTAVIYIKDNEIWYEIVSEDETHE
jgi:hypothetical protein